MKSAVSLLALSYRKTKYQRQIEKQFYQLNVVHYHSCWFIRLQQTKVKYKH